MTDLYENLSSEQIKKHNMLAAGSITFGLALPIFIFLLLELNSIKQVSTSLLNAGYAFVAYIAFIFVVAVFKIDRKSMSYCKNLFFVFFYLCAVFVLSSIICMLISKFYLFIQNWYGEI